MPYFLISKKAFDKVSHRHLLLKLSCLNLDPSVLNWIREFLTHRRQFVVANSCKSPLSHVHSGVPQGTVLGPLLFSIYINDLPRNINSNIRLFADDCVLYHPITNVLHSSILQSDLNTIQEWCKDWLMSLNINKTFVMTFHRRKDYIANTYTLHNHPVAAANTTKYLGVHISSDLTWSLHIISITNSANRVLGYLRRNLASAPASTKLTAYKTLVRPKLEYANAIFDPHQANLSTMLESIQNRASRFIISNYSTNISVSAVKSQLNLPHLASRRKVSRLCLYHRFFHSLPPGNAFIRPVHRTSRHSHPNAVYPVRPKTKTFQKSFFLQTAQDWNDLPAHIAMSSQFAQFKTAVKSHILSL